MAIADYSNTAASNTTVSGINIAEGCSPAGINNALRQIMADIKDFYDVVPSVSSTETVSETWTYTANQKFNDNVKAVFGTGGDLEVYHNGGNSVIADVGVGGLTISGSTVDIQDASGVSMIRARSTLEATLYYNGSAKLVTTNTGATITGLLSGDTIGGAMVSTDISADTGSTVKVPHVAAVEAAISSMAEILTIATRQSASGTAVDFTGIPSGTKEVVIMFDGVSTNGTGGIIVRLGDSGGFETTGYISGSTDAAATATASDGLVVRLSTSGDTLTGSMVLNLMDAATFQWVQRHGMYRNGSSSVSGGGSKTLSAELTQIRVTTSAGTDTFDAGTINIAYR